MLIVLYVVRELVSHSVCSGTLGDELAGDRPIVRIRVCLQLHEVENSVFRKSIITDLRSFWAHVLLMEVPKCARSWTFGNTE